MGGQGAGGIEPGHTNGSDHCFRAAGDNGHTVAALEDLISVTDRIGTAGTGRGGTDIRAFSADIDGDLGASHIRDHHRDKEGADPVRAFLN